MIIKLNEDLTQYTNLDIADINPDTKILEIYHSEYTGGNDKTIIFKEVFERGEDGKWIHRTDEIVGWHWGEPGEDTEQYINKTPQHAQYDAVIDDEFLATVLTAEGYAADFFKIVQK